MNNDDFKKALHGLKEISPVATEDQAIAKTLDKLQKQVIKRGNKDAHRTTARNNFSNTNLDPDELAPNLVRRAGI